MEKSPQAASETRGESIRVLAVEHSSSDVQLCLRELRKAGFEVHLQAVETLEAFTERLQREPYDVILADYNMPGWTGIEALSVLKHLAKDIPFILVSGTIGEETAVECLKQGTTDYVLKDRLVRLPSVVRRALKEKALREEQNRAKQILQESEERYRRLFENATHGIYRVTTEGKFLDLNPALVAMLGYSSKEELVAVNVAEQVYRYPQDRVRLMEQYAKTGRIEGAEVEWKRKDGTPITVRLSGRAVPDERGGVECFEVMIEDVTQRRTLEKHLFQVQKFEAIGQLAGGIAHDFNNMVGAILGWAELGLEEASASSSLHNYFQKVRQQADRAAALTRQLLAFARRQILEPRNINLSDTITEVMGLLEKVIGKDIEVQLRLAPDLEVVHADPTQIEQVLTNLCLNARDAMPNGGRLVIETRNVEFDEEFCRRHVHARPGRYVQLAISDTGLGMDQATLERIFEPFFTTKGPGKGTGLGLATLYGIVKQHSGFVYVYSEPGQGTTFRIYLPARQGRVEKAELGKPEAEAACGGTETILLAEDHEGLREMAANILRRLGYHVLVTADGDEAVQLFEAHRDRIALVLLDVVLPKLNGPDAYARMRALRPELPVLFTTGYSSETTPVNSVLAEGVAILQKPYTPAALGAKVRAVLDRCGQR